MGLAGEHGSCKFDLETTGVGIDRISCIHSYEVKSRLIRDAALECSALVFLLQYVILVQFTP